MIAVRIEHAPEVPFSGPASISAVELYGDTVAGRYTEPNELVVIFDDLHGAEVVVENVHSTIGVVNALSMRVKGSLQVLAALMRADVRHVATAKEMADAFTALWHQAPLGVRTLHDIEVRVQHILSAQSYVSEHPALVRSPFIEWRTLHAVEGASPNFRLMALVPPVTIMKQADRARYFPAPEGDLWVDVHWPDLQWQVLSLMAKDGLLASALTGLRIADLLPTGLTEPAHRDAALAALLRCNGRQPDYVYAAVPSTAQWPQAAARGLCETYRAMFGTAEVWLHERAIEAFGDGTWAGLPFDYVLKTRTRKTPEETYRSACAGIVQHAEALQLRFAILRWDAERERRAGREFLGVGSLIPLHDRLLYTLDRDVPIPPHVATAKTLLTGPYTIPTPTEVRMGATAGTVVHRVDGEHYALGEVALNLALPDESVLCPKCQRTAMTRKSLERHLVEAHAAAE